MFRQVCIIEPSFFNTTSGIHRRPLEGRHLVNLQLKLMVMLTKTAHGQKISVIVTSVNGSWDSVSHFYECQFPPMTALGMGVPWVSVPTHDCSGIGGSMSVSSHSWLLWEWGFHECRFPLMTALGMGFPWASHSWLLWERGFHELPTHDCSGNGVSMSFPLMTALGMGSKRWTAKRILLSQQSLLAVPLPQLMMSQRALPRNRIPVAALLFAEPLQWAV